MASTSVKRQGLSAADKKDLLKRYDELPDSLKTTQEIAASQLNISRSSLSRILKNRKEILEQDDSDRKRQRTGKAPNVEKALVKWIETARDKNAPLSGKIVKAKSEELASKMNVEGFSATEGWFGRFKQREGIVHKRLHGEGQTADDQSRGKWLAQVWPDLKSRYKSDQIWNADESGLYIRALPDATLTFKNDQRKGAKKPKERITVLFACSMTGEKRKMLVIGKSQNPRCFKGMTSLPVSYEANKSAWMTSVLFKKWLAEWDKELRGQNKRILLLVDNCSAHPQNVELTNIEVAFFPPNTTALLQPCDQGVIRAVKAHYRRYMCQRILQQLDSNDSSTTACVLAKRINLLHAIELLVMSWADITDVTIRNCWRAGGLNETQQEEVVNTADDAEDWSVIISSDRFDEYVDIDNDVQTSAEVTDEDIIDQVIAETSSQDSDAESDENDSQIVEAEKPPSNKDMRAALETLKRGLYDRGCQDFRLIQRLEREVNRRMTESCAQAKITALFS